MLLHEEIRLQSAIIPPFRGFPTLTAFLPAGNRGPASLPRSSLNTLVPVIWSRKESASTYGSRPPTVQTSHMHSPDLPGKNPIASEGEAFLFRGLEVIFRQEARPRTPEPGGKEDLEDSDRRRPRRLRTEKTHQRASRRSWSRCPGRRGA